MFDFGEKIFELRKQRNWTQKTLAEKLGISDTTVSKYETCAASPPVEILTSLASIFNVSMDELCGMTPKGNLPLYGLNDNQKELIKELAETFRGNAVSTRQTAAQKYALLGRILEELKK